FNKISDPQYWINAADEGDGHVTPDFYNSEDKLMMDVMRITDKEGKKGKNPDLARENRISKELRKKLNLKDDTKVFVNAPDMSLSTEEHHSFKKYCHQSNRVISSHINEIPIYEKNHPNFDLVFYIYDESTPYYEYECSNIHYPWLDKNFIYKLMDSNVKYLLWYCPYKIMEEVAVRPPEAKASRTYVPFPIAVFDLTKLSESELRTYDYSAIISGEE
ncbi:hypothetical protein, partial [Clostridioides difficile]|uniref:hypothetical protein n=1 Tax=Clostridioides difficile TaxID=1496 RepID=UPI00051754F4